MKDYIKITFNIINNASLHSIKNGKTSLKCDIVDGTLVCNVYYDYNEKPLTLNTEVTKGDKIELIIMPFRIELWVNSVLEDEEWPTGKCLYSINDIIKSNIEVNVSEYTYKKIFQPSIIKTFTNAQGWQPSDKVFVGDCMPYTYNGRYHVLYLKDRRHHKSKWGNGAHQWEHISTNDFNLWEIHPLAVDISDPYEGSICTGSWIIKDGIHYLFYTVRTTDNSPATIRRSISDDGNHYEKDGNFSLVLSEKYHQVSARDPKVILSDDGLYHMFLTTSLVSINKGCLAHLVSKDLNLWTEIEKPIYVSENEIQPECPDYIYYHGYYYLIFSLNGNAHYIFSKNPFDGWMVPDDPIIPCASVPKGAIWNDKIVFVGFNRISGYAGTMNFLSATSKDNGVLIFERCNY